MKHAIDGAFVDRADLRLMIDYPAPNAIHNILRSAIGELLLKRIILSDEHTVPIICRFLFSNSKKFIIDPTGINTFLNGKLDNELKKLSQTLKGLSGRQLRKLPFLAYASCLNRVSQIPISLFLKSAN